MFFIVDIFLIFLKFIVLLYVFVQLTLFNLINMFLQCYIFIKLKSVRFDIKMCLCKKIDGLHILKKFIFSKQKSKTPIFVYID